MARTVLAGPAPVNNFVGQFNIPNTVIEDDGATVAGIELDGSTMLARGVFAELMLEQSLDGGATWGWPSSSQVEGGFTSRATGLPVAKYNCVLSLLPAARNIKRRVRGYAKQSGAALTSQVTAYTE